MKRSSSSSSSSAFQQSVLVGLGVVLAAVGLLLCPQPKITNVVEEIALPLATKYIQARQGQNYQTQQSPIIEDPKRPLQGLQILITGPTSGIGKGMAIVLSQLGASIIGVGRSETKLQALQQDDILKDYIVADMADLESVAQASNQILERYDSMDMLIANAGIHYHWTTMGSPATKQGLDQVYGVNYMAHFLLIEKVAPLLLPSKYAKLLYVNSFFHYAVDGSALLHNTSLENTMPSPPQWIYANTSCPHPFFRDQYMYGSSKFSLMLHAEHIRKRYHPRVHVVSADPGWTATNLNGQKGSILYHPLQWIGFPVMGWGLSSQLHALFALNDYSSKTKATSTTSNKIFWVNAQNYYILPKMFNSPIWTNHIPRWIKDGLRLRDWIIVVQGFALGFLQRFHYEAFPMPPAKEILTEELQDNVYAWSQQIVAEWLE